MHRGRQSFTGNERKARAMELLRPSAPFGRLRHALFDFDGTISVVREGWERVMVPLMVEILAGDEGDPDGAIRREVEHYVDASTGIQTIVQMQWLAEAVARRGGQPRAPEDYKAIYARRLHEPVYERLARLAGGECSRDDLMLEGAEDFVQALAARGLTLYLASGTDAEDVRHEAAALGVAKHFQGGIFGAIGSIADYSKAQVIGDILETNGLHGPELVVLGDGPVEIREGKARGAITVGVASDEVRRHGLNPRKRQRLVDAGADTLVPDFTAADELLSLLFPAPR